MDYSDDDDDEPKIKKYLEWIVIPILTVLSCVTFGFSVNSLILITQWNSQFVIPKEQKTTCDQLRQSRRKQEESYQVSVELDWVCCVCLGLSSFLLFVAFIAARVVKKEKHKTKRYTSLCGFNCAFIILLTGTVALLASFNKIQQTGKLHAIHDETRDDNTIHQLNALQKYIDQCSDLTEKQMAEASWADFDEEEHGWDDVDKEGVKVVYSDCYEHCPLRNTRTLWTLTIVLASLCFVFGSPVLYFIIQFWLPKPRIDDRYAHLAEKAKNDPQGRPAYVLNETFIRTPSDYTFEHPSLHHTPASWE